MSMREREGLIARIRHIRRLAAAAEQPSAVSTHPDPEVIRALDSRIAHLEQLLEGLQDSVHRESARQAKLIAELEARLQPSAMSAALSKDARERGLQVAALAIFDMGHYEPFLVWRQPDADAQDRAREILGCGAYSILEFDL